MKKLFTILFFLAAGYCFSQGNPTITVSPTATTKQVKIEIKKSDLNGTHPFYHLGSSPYGEWSEGMWEEDSLTFFTYLTIVYVPLEPDTIKLLAKNFLATGGTVADPSPFAGNLGTALQGDVVGYYNTGDWLKYSANLTGKQKIKLRYSCAHPSLTRKMEVRIGSITGPVIAEMPAESTGSWTTFIDKTIPINADTSSLGVQDIFFVITGTDGYWGNLTDLITIY